MVCDDNLILILSARVDADCFSLYFCYGALFTCDFKRSLQLLISPPHPCSGRCIARSYTRLNYHRNSIVLFFILQPYTFVLFSINTPCSYMAEILSTQRKTPSINTYMYTIP